jgi:hypothetical protein
LPCLESNYSLDRGIDDHFLHSFDKLGRVGTCEIDYMAIDSLSQDLHVILDKFNVVVGLFSRMHIVGST